jgi:hypothetical protein
LRWLVVSPVVVARRICVGLPNRIAIALKARRRLRYTSPTPPSTYSTLRHFR